MHILLPIDGSPYTARMLDYVTTHPGVLGADPEVTLLFVQRMPSPRELAYESHDEVDARLRTSAEAVFDPARGALEQLGISPRVETRRGVPGPEIVRYCDEHSIDLIVMGSHGRTALSGLLLGSVTSLVLSQTNVPMLIVR
jgi:nucleotide-binding universal stress UspA family protein